MGQTARLIHVIKHKMLGLAKTSKSFLIEKGDLVLIDKGQTGDNTRNVINFLRDLVKENEAIDLCILTHRHRDHMGGLRCLKDVYGFEVVSHSSEADAVERSTGVGVDLRLEDGDVIPRYGGLRVIHVLGYTEGNICLLASESLFAGDTVFGGRGGLRPPPSHFNSDPEEALRGVAKLDLYEFDAVYVSQGEDLPDGGKERLEELLKRL